jgi:hypothetical protein
VWSSIADFAKRLADPTLQPDDRTGPDRELGELLSWSPRSRVTGPSPGPQRVGQLRALVAAGDFELASRIAELIARSLVGDTPAGKERDRPSFEVLVVADSWQPDDLGLSRLGPGLGGPARGRQHDSSMSMLSNPIP